MELRLNLKILYKMSNWDKDLGQGFWLVTQEKRADKAWATIVLSFAVSLLILSRTIAGSTVVMLLMIRSVVSSPISGRGCRDRKSSGSALSFPDSYVNSKSTSYMSMTLFSMRGGSLVVALLNRGSSGF